MAEGQGEPDNLHTSISNISEDCPPNPVQLKESTEMDTRNSTFDKSDHSEGEDLDNSELKNLVNDTEKLVKQEPVDFELVKTEPVELELVKTEPDEAEADVTGADEGETGIDQGKGGGGDVTFILTDIDGTAAETWYSLDVTTTHICQDESHKESQEGLIAKITELETALENSSANHKDSELILVAEYERKLCAMTDEADEWKARAMALDRDKVTLIHERDQARADLHNVEAAFSDVHSKYERVKEVLRNSSLNQDVLESRDLELRDKLKLAHEQIAELEDEYKEKLTSVYTSFEARLKNQDLESTRLRAQLRKLQMKNETLENEVKQKTSEVAKLSSLCDELINKV